MRKWQKVLIAIVVFGTVAYGTFPAKALADKLDSDQIEGSWYITIQLTDPFQLTFDATYSFAEGGAFTRIDGRNNAPAVGTWKHTEDGRFIFSNILFNFNNGVRNGAIAGKFAANVINGTMTGTFTADGILGLTGFHRAGTFTGVPIPVEAP